MKRHLYVGLLTGISALALSAAQAQAQTADATAGKPAPAQATPPLPPEGDKGLDEIVITGSRVIRNGNDSPTPVSVINTEQFLNLQPTSVVDAVSLAPALQGSQTLSSNPGGGQRNGAAAYLNLRDLGDLRTLVLMDGHRVVPTINQNQANTDSWVIPQLLTQRVDVVTGGVSAVYGSDAVSGVVNFITDNKFNGLKTQASGGISTYGDDVERDFGIAYGKNILSGNGHVEFSYEYRKDPGILDQADRPFFAQSLGGAGLGTAASPYYNVTNTRISNTTFGGLITSGPLAGMQFAQNGVLSPFNAGVATGTANVQSGGDGAWYNTASIKSAQEMHQLFGRFDYNFSDIMHAYVQISGVFDSTADAFRAPLEPVTIGYNNAFLASVPQVAAQAALTPNGSFSFSRLFDIPATAEQQTNTYMIHGGVDGSIGDYKWQLGFGQSQSVIKAQNDVNVDQGKFLAAINAVKSPTTGQIVCNAALTNANYANCVPLNPFGPTAQSAAAMQYVLAQTWNQNSTTLTDIDGSISGSPLSTWAGPIDMAVSGEWRRTSWDITSNAGPNDPIDCNGIQFGCVGSGLSQTPRWLQTTEPASPTKTQSVKEGAIEADVPLLKDMSFADALNVNGAARYTDYSTSGSVVTWKVGTIYRPVSELTLRGTLSRDIRAPNLFELYAPTTIAPSTVSDPLTGTAGRVGVATISNTKLVPEVTRSITGGFVWTPHFVPHFSFSVDAFKINVEHAIAQLSGNSSSVLQLCDSTGGTNSACSTIIRPFPYTNTTAANFPTLLTQQWLNIASFRTYGADFEANYNTNVDDHSLVLRALVSWQPHLVFNQGPAGIIDVGNTATGVNLYPSSPGVKFTLIADIGLTDDLTLSILERGRSAMKAVGVVSGQPQKVFLNSAYDPAIAYTNMTLSYALSDFYGSTDTQVYLNVLNLFNAQPNPTYAGANSSPGVGLSGFFPPNGDDIVGRYFTVGFRSKF